MASKNAIKKKIVKPDHNVIKKRGKHVVTLGEGKDPIPLPSGRPQVEQVGRGPSARGPPVGPLGKRPYKLPREDAVFIDTVQLRARYGGRSFMWLERLLQRDPTFPRPIRVNRLRFFRLDEVEAWERQTATQRAETGARAARATSAAARAASTATRSATRAA